MSKFLSPASTFLFQMVRYRVLAFISVLIVLASCQEITPLGISVIPPSDSLRLISNDTTTIQATTVREDSVLMFSSVSSTLSNACGNLFDPKFGRTYAALFTQLSLTTNDINFGSPDTLFFDSAAFVLQYNSTYALQNVPQSFNVYEVNEPMTPMPTNGYFSNRSFSTNQEVIGRARLTYPIVVDSAGDVAGQLLHIRLSDRFGANLFNQSGTSNFHDDSTFKLFLKGICVAPDTAFTPYGGGMYFFLLPASSSGIYLYWHTTHSTNRTFLFPVSTLDARLSYLHHNYGQTFASQHIGVVKDSVNLMQSLSGLKTRINIPVLNTLRNVVINKAELVFNQIPDPQQTDSIFAAPVIMRLVWIDSVGDEVFTKDVTDGFPNYGGVRNLITINGKQIAQYKFSVADEVQRIVSGIDPNNGFYLVAYSPGETGDRFICGSPYRTDTLRMKLNLIYTRIE